MLLLPLVSHSVILLPQTWMVIINAEITEMAYGSNSALPAKSNFDRITISLSVWSKDGGEAQVFEGDDVDDLMEF